MPRKLSVFVDVGIQKECLKWQNINTHMCRERKAAISSQDHNHIHRTADKNVHTHIL